MVPLELPATDLLVSEVRGGGTGGAFTGGGFGGVLGALTGGAGGALTTGGRKGSLGGRDCARSRPGVRLTDLALWCE